MLHLKSYLKNLKGVCKEPNLTDRFTDEDLDAIGQHCWTGYDRDEASRADWFRRTQAGMELALQMTEEKSFPWQGASNVAFPLITIAALQFHARSYTTLFAGPDIVKYRVAGPDPDGTYTQRATLVARYMSHQVLDLDESFEEQHDRLLVNVPIVGCAFVKTRRNAARNINNSTLVLARDLVVDYYAKSIEGAARKTHIIPLYRNEIYERCVAGTFRDIREEEWYKVPFSPPSLPHEGERDRVEGRTAPEADEATPILFGEQHNWLDLDNDGYAEPYIVTFDLKNKKVVRIAARWEDDSDIEMVDKEILRITATEYFTKYGLIPAPDGSIYDVGFSVLLGPLNESANTIINQLIDAGTMTVAAGGFISKGVKIRGGQISFKPFGWQRVESTGDDLNKGIVPYPVREPSNVLFALLQLLINYTQRISGATDTIVGENPGQNTPANNMNAMIEQGLQVYSASFKRLWRSMRDEFRKCFILNARHMPDSVKFGADTVNRAYFLEDPSNLVPAADPNLTSESMRLQQALTLKQMAGQTPGYDRDAVERRVLQTMRVDGVEVLFPGSKALPPGDSEKIAIEKLRAQREQLKAQVQNQQFMLTLMETQRLNRAKISEIEAKIVKIMSDVEGDEKALKLEGFQTILDAMKSNDEMMTQRLQMMFDADLAEKQAAAKEEKSGDSEK